MHDADMDVPASQQLRKLCETKENMFMRNMTCVSKGSQDGVAAFSKTIA